MDFSQKNLPVLSSIIIGTNDIKRAKEFYRAVFGIVIEKDESMYISAHGIDGTHIEIETDSEYRFPNWQNHNIGTYKNSEFIVADIHEFVKTVENSGGKVISQPKIRPWGTFAAEIADPDGNIFLIVSNSSESKMAKL